MYTRKSIHAHMSFEPNFAIQITDRYDYDPDSFEFQEDTTRNVLLEPLHISSNCCVERKCKDLIHVNISDNHIIMIFVLILLF